MNPETKPKKMSEIKVGDIIKAYHKGIHKVIEIGTYIGGTPYVAYEKMLNENMTTSGKRVNTCHPHGCTVITKEELRKELKEKLNEITKNYERAISELDDEN